MLAGWYNFYSLAGSASATLAGLLFVAVTLSVGVGMPALTKGVQAFLTPALVHFGGVLFQAFVVLAPWPSEKPVAVLIGGLGFAGAIYTGSFAVLIGRQKFVSLEWENWIVYVGAPAIANLCSLGAGLGFWTGWPLAPYSLAASTVVLMLIGVYQAWDLTLWIVRNRATSV